MAGLNVEDPIATYLVALFEDDSSPKMMQFLAAAIPLGPAPTTQMRLFGTMTASPPIVLFFADSNHCQHLQIAPKLPHTASDRFARQVYEQPTRMLAGGRPAQRANRLQRLTLLSRTIQRVRAPIGAGVRDQRRRR